MQLADTDKFNFFDFVSGLGKTYLESRAIDKTTELELAKIKAGTVAVPAMQMPAIYEPVGGNQIVIGAAILAAAVVAFAVLKK